MLVTLLVIALVAPSIAYAGDVEHKTFKQICVLLELDDDEKKSLP
jgi:hypothetical protein